MDRTTLLAYRRRSVVKTRMDQISPARQTKAVEALAEARGWGCEWYEDVEGHKSGRTEEGRPGWLALRAQLERPDIVGVGAYSLSRISRNVQDFLRLLDDLERRELALITVKESIDTSSAVGRAVVTILMSIYQLESDLASERMTESIAYKRRTLGRHWGLRPFGCARDEELQLIPGEDVGTLRRAYELYATGNYGYNSLARKLNEEGLLYRDRHGKQRAWNRQDTRRILHAWKLHAGYLPLGPTKDPDREVLPGGHDPILDPELCASVGAILLDRAASPHRTRRDRRAPVRVYILSGVLHCATCEQPLDGYLQDGTPRYRHRWSKDDCPEKWINAEEIESEVLHQLTDTLLSSAIMDALRQEADRLSEEGLPGKIQQEIAGHRERLHRLTDLYLDSGIEKVEYLVKRMEIEAAINQLRTDHPLDTDLHAVIDSLEGLVSHLADARPERQKALVETIYERLLASRGTVTEAVPQPWARDFF